MVEETKEQPRLQHMKKIELAMAERFANEKLYEMEPQPGYETMEFEAKNATKYMATFPFPYMNGYLHLGKLFVPVIIWDNLYLFCFVVSKILIMFQFNCIRSRILDVQGRVHDEIPEIIGKARTFPIRFPLHWHAHLFRSYSSAA